MRFFRFPINVHARFFKIFSNQEIDLIRNLEQNEAQEIGIDSINRSFFYEIGNQIAVRYVFRFSEELYTHVRPNLFGRDNLVGSQSKLYIYGFPRKRGGSLISATVQLLPRFCLSDVDRINHSSVQLCLELQIFLQ